MSQANTGQVGITAEWLRQVLDEVILDGKHRKPSAAAREELLTALHSIENRKVEVLLGDPLLDRVVDAIATLANSLPAIRERLLAGHRRADFALVNRLLTETGHARRRAGQWAAYNAFDWHNIVGDLASAFQAAMRSTNPTICFPVSNKGPTARFLVLAVRALTGEEVDSQTIARHLQRKDDLRSKG